MKKIVIALGGNALGKNAIEQKEIVKVTAKAVLDLYEQGNKVVVVHGNGPQVGMINNSFASAEENMPFPECGAMSQGYIGYHIQNAISNEAKKRGVDVSAVSLITQTIVDKNDPAFKNPTKPIGTFYKKEEVEKLSEEKGWTMKEDAGRGYRRVIASPEPLKIVEDKAIAKLLESNTIIITGGGGGVPVIDENGTLVGVDAVIDKDATASKIASSIKADAFMILTAVDKILLHYGTPQQQEIDEINTRDLVVHYDNKMFAEGSMKPKVKAVLDFVNETGKEAYIADLQLVDGVLSGKTGTKIIK